MRIVRRSLSVLRNQGSRMVLVRAGLKLRYWLRQGPQALSRRRSERRYQDILTTASPVDGLIEADVLGFRMLIPAHDRGVCRELLVHGVHEPAAVTELLRLLHRPSTIVDVGSNIGYYALLEASRVVPGGRVLAIEPHPDNLRVLQKNIVLNRFEDKIEVFDCGVSNRRGRRGLFVEPFGNWHHFDHFPGDPCLASSSPATVNVTTVDELCSENRVGQIDLLRLDVEGHEYAVIEGARRVLDASPRCVIFLELHPWLLEQLGRDPRQVLADLRDLGFRCAVVCGRGRPRRQLGWPELLSHPDVLVSRHGSHMFFTKSRG